MEKILLVDDEEKIRRIYKSLLSLEHYEMLEAKDAEAAINLMEGQKDIGLILLDINMPLINGATLYEVINKTYHPRPRIIVTSAYPLEEQKQLIDKADDYYDKSQGTDVLLSKIRNVLKKGDST